MLCVSFDANLQLQVYPQHFPGTGAAPTHLGLRHCDIKEQKISPL